MHRGAIPSQVHFQSVLQARHQPLLGRTTEDRTNAAQSSLVTKVRRDLTTVSGVIESPHLQNPTWEGFTQSSFDQTV